MSSVETVFADGVGTPAYVAHEREPLSEAYRVEVVPADGGLSAVLNQFAAEGWRVVNSHVVPVSKGGGLVVVAGQERAGVGLGLLVILERRGS